MRFVTTSKYLKRLTFVKFLLLWMTNEHDQISVSEQLARTYYPASVLARTYIVALKNMVVVLSYSYFRGLFYIHKIFAPRFFCGTQI